MLSKNDPVYYKKKIGDLLNTAVKEGLSLDININNTHNRVNLNFRNLSSDECATISFNCDNK